MQYETDSSSSTSTLNAYTATATIDQSSSIVECAIDFDLLIWWITDEQKNNSDFYLNNLVNNINYQVISF